MEALRALHPRQYSILRQLGFALVTWSATKQLYRDESGMVELAIYFGQDAAHEFLHIGLGLVGNGFMQHYRLVYPWTTEQFQMGLEKVGIPVFAPLRLKKLHALISDD